MRRIAPIALLALAACDPGPDPAELAQIRQGTAAVRAKLVDPASARFRSVEVYEQAVCGEVNASVGVGLTGYERFIVARDAVTLASQLPTQAAMAERWARWCRR